MFPNKKLTAIAAVALLIPGAFSSFPAALKARQTGTFVPKPGYYPANGDDTIAGGIFCISLTDLSTYLSKTGNNPGATGTESPRTPGQATSGSGPYPAAMVTDSSLPNHTVYAPKSPPAGNVSMPFIAFGNGACVTDGSSYKNLLVEVASHGYVIVADGAPGGSGSGQSKTTDMRTSIDWATNGGAAKYGNIDITRIATMGHSCGGLEGMSVAYHDARVKRIVMLDIAIFQDERRYLLHEINVPVAWFVGGPKDMGYPNAQKDYALLNAGLPAYKASLDTGHGGTFSATNGGKFGKAVVSYLEWQFRNNTASKSVCLDSKSSGSLVSDNWTVDYKNW
ncbi:hypothetical protein F5Y19DRAFT_458892 [Xylariaceae sp. FL1651]|nr:hypothetical protein F5Y19DRAFT_458892 [Xylariaceae sp. FL1651]